MCGISGVYALHGTDLPDHPEAMSRAMADRMIHRGPDSAGTWSNERADVGFGHRRLAIVDLTPAGHQPMTSRDGRWTITYNGELYNAGSVSTALGVGPDELRGHSDTEVLLEAIATWGVDRALERIVGMFAFAAYDRESDELWLARDRFGEKPLYYTATGSLFAFASELHGLRTVPGVSAEIDRSSVVELCERSSISAPYTILEGVRKLVPGARARVRRDGAVDVHRYFDPTQVALGTATVVRSDDEVIEELDALLEEIVRERMVADVPLGAFLSGGVDSALVVAMMQRCGASARTYTIGFEDPAVDEAPAARTIAAALGTDHHEWVVTGADALAVVPELARLYDEPFADSSQIPTLLVSRFARRDLTVALSGDGGDELFGGYERYRYFERAARTHRLPGPVRLLSASVLTALDEDRLDRLGGGPIGRALPGPFRRRTGKRVHTAAAMLRARSLVDLYDLLMCVHRDGPVLVRGGERRERAARHPIDASLGPLDIGRAVDTVDYLPEDILTKVDRAAMSASLETRAPLLDHRLHEFAWTVEPRQLVRDGVGKWLMREAVRRHVPAIADLPKRGFAVPLADWLRGPLREWTESTLSESTLRSGGVFDADAVRRLVQQHLSGTVDRSAELWPVLMMQAWTERSSG